MCYKDSILNTCPKRKNTKFTASEGYSPTVREAGQKLIECAKYQGKPLKLRFNKVVMDDKTFSLVLSFVFLNSLSHCPVTKDKG